MWKRMRSGIIALVVSAASTAWLAAAPAYASPALGSSTSAPDSATQNIWSGLWYGVNLEFPTAASGSATAAPSAGDPPLPGPAASSGTTAVPAQTSNVYAALGDSVAAGVGLANPVSVPSAYTRCGRTSETYPYQVASSLNLSLVHAACSGATAGDLFTVQRAGSPNLPPQLDTAFASGTPRLITITAGANDAHWVQFIGNCYYSNCATGGNTTLANGYLVTLSAKLYALFGDIWLRSGGHPPTTVITGYYNPVSAACTSKYPNNVTPAEIQWINGEVSALNKTIQNVASVYSYVRFAPVDFSGHDICSIDSWVQGPSDAEPFHPTATGQQVMASAALTALGR